MEHFTSNEPAHTSLPISREDFERSKIKRESYSTEKISKAIIDHLSRSEEELTTRQRKATRKYDKDGRWSIGKPLNVKDLKRFYEIFNDIFFNGLLSENCPITISSGDPAYLAICKPTKNVSFSRRWLFWGLRIEVVVGKTAPVSLEFNSWKVPIDALEATKEILGTLLHEMLHALFFSYECTCSTECLELAISNYEKTRAHGNDWLRAAHAIEKASRGENCAKLFNVDLDLGRLTMAAHHMAMQGTELPEEPGFSDWLDHAGFDKENILEELEKERRWEQVVVSEVSQTNDLCELNEEPTSIES